MSNTNETHDQGCLDHNLDRLLELGEPAPGMPEDLKARIRSKLTEARRESVKKRILPRRWALWPVAATIIAAVILIVLWYGNSSKAIAWADVEIARPSRTPGGKPCVAAFFTEEGALKMGRLTKSHMGKNLVVILDGKAFSVFPIAKEYTSGRVLIPGDFTEEEAGSIAKGIMVK